MDLEVKDSMTQVLSLLDHMVQPEGTTTQFTGDVNDKSDQFLSSLDITVHPDNYERCKPQKQAQCWQVLAHHEATQLVTQQLMTLLQSELQAWRNDLT